MVFITQAGGKCQKTDLFKFPIDGKAAFMDTISDYIQTAHWAASFVHSDVCSVTAIVDTWQGRG